MLILREMKAWKYLIAVVLPALCGCGGCSGGASGGGQPDVVAAANRRCPVPVENVGFVNSVTLSGDTLVYTCMVTERSVDLEVLGRALGAVKRTMQPTLASLFDADPGLLDALHDNGWILSVRYTDARGRTLAVDFPADEVGADPAGFDPETALADELALSKASLPAQIAAGVTVTDVVDRGGMVVFECDVDERLEPAAMANLRRVRSQLRMSMSEALNSGGDADVERLVDVTTSAGRGIAYHYTGTVTGDTLTISFPPSELVR